MTKNSNLNLQSPKTIRFVVINVRSQKLKSLICQTFNNIFSLSLLKEF